MSMQIQLCKNCMGEESVCDNPGYVWIFNYKEKIQFVRDRFSKYPIRYEPCAKCKYYNGTPVCSAKLNVFKECLK